MQTGLGRTGRLFAFEHFGVEPDIILTANGIASGMPLGAVIMRAELEGRFSQGIGRVCGGNPVCCAASLATLDLVESTYLANAKKLGEQLKRELCQIAEARKIVTNVRGLGLMCAVDIINRRSGKGDPRARQSLLVGCFERGLILLPCGEAGVLFCPALCINEAQLDVGLKVFESGVAAVA
jgi:4-aminobutyrate aminotransferase